VFNWLIEKIKNNNNKNKNNQNEQYKNLSIPDKLSEVEKLFRQIYQAEKNQDIIFRPLNLKGSQKKALIIYLDGMVKVDSVENDLIRPLLTIESSKLSLPQVLENILFSKAGKLASRVQEVVKAINEGNTFLFLDGEKEGLIIPTIGYEHRSIERPQIEPSIRGPQEGFVEVGQVNRALIRKTIRSEHLISEPVTIGKQTVTEVSILYMNNIVDPDLVKEVKSRLEGIDYDNFQDITFVEQFIEERSYSLIPSLMSTERPDRVVNHLLNGYVVLLQNNSSLAIILPITFWDLFHIEEDKYERWPYANYMMILRALAGILAVIISPFYVAIVIYHREMVPIDLLLAIAGTREVIPIPVVIEVWLMELFFELIIEAGTRTPTTMGSTLSIVGALILGQAAVQANIVSPILIIVVAISGLSAFTISNISLRYIARITKFLFIIFATLFGFFGLAFIIILYLAYFTSFKSFGVPFFTPLAPNYAQATNLFIRPPLWKELFRPKYLVPKNLIRGRKGDHHD